MKSVFLIFLLLHIFPLILCQFEIPDEFKDAKDAIESDYYKDALDTILQGQQLPELTRGGRIAGGEKAVMGQFPYHALLYMADDQRRRYVCGGVLVKYNLILTAAHCIERFAQVDVFLGVINRIDGPAAWKSDPITDPKHLIVHPEFEARLLKNDIGLIHLEGATEDLLDHEHIAVMEVPSFSEGNIDFTGMVGTLSGFGQTEAGTSSPVLKFARFRIISNEECYDTFPGLIVSSTLCVETSIRASPCQGDSGGPLTVEISPNRRVVVGLTSFGSKFGCTSSYPVAFQRVTDHLIWLDDYLTGSYLDDNFEEIDIMDVTSTTDSSCVISFSYKILILFGIFSLLT